MLDFARLLRRAEAEGWSILVLDLGVDMTTPNGRLIVHVLMAVAQWEREMIGQRIRELAEVKANGKHLGRPSTVPATTHAKISALRNEGLGFRTIAARLPASLRS